MVRNGEVSPSSELTPESLVRKNEGSYNDGESYYRRLWLAEMETLINYFGEEWFDFESMITEEVSRTRSSSSAKPYRCPVCERPWSPIGASKLEYYKESFFHNIPMEKSVCRECSNALPAGAN
tara:strand:+ start:9128 stop:9496 length:369 start_codon:yes stop_codon:yes gene_type:complete